MPEKANEKNQQMIINNYRNNKILTKKYVISALDREDQNLRRSGESIALCISVDGIELELYFKGVMEIGAEAPYPLPVGLTNRPTGFHGGFPIRYTQENRSRTQEILRIT